MRKIDCWEDFLDEMIGTDYDLGENVTVTFEGNDYLFDNEQFDDYRKTYGEVVIDTVHHPVLEHLLEYKFLIKI